MMMMMMTTTTTTLAEHGVLPRGVQLGLQHGRRAGPRRGPRGHPPHGPGGFCCLGRRDRHLLVRRAARDSLWGACTMF
jgi:hypothetical protein